MKNKKIIFIVSGIILLLIIGTFVIINYNNLNDQPGTELNDGKSNEDVIIDKVTFSEITNTYNGGITTLSAKMLNNTKETKNFKIKIILKDENGLEIKSMMQVVENLQPGKTKVLTTGIGGDYSNVTKIEFQIVE
ncbi:MAG: hypothetical protein ACM3O4_00095 [Ignavibacteriales bacterium]